MTQQGTTNIDEPVESTAQASDVSVTMIATPGDASCGIGTYGRDLRAALEGVDSHENTSTVGGASGDGPGDAGDPATPNNSGVTTGSSGTPEPSSADPAGSGAAVDGGTTVDGSTDGTVDGRTGGARGTDVGANTDAIELEQDDPTAGHFLSVALRAAARDSDVVHVQHEYGLFRRPGSIYPGLFGLLFFPVLWFATRVRRKSIVVTLHSVLAPEPEEARFSKRLYLLVMHELLARIADHLIFLSEDCEEHFHEDVAQAPDEYSVLPHGVNVRDASQVDRTTARERFGLDPADRVVAIPGFIRPPKGHDVFVEVAKELPSVEFLIAGGARPKGFDQGFVEEIAAEAPENVTITGVLDDEDFPVALSTADLALLPYRVVSQSGTFNWCAAQELPILASDRSYFERIEREWDAVETVGIDDVEAIAARVESLLADDDRRTELARNVRQFKDANSFEAVAARHLGIYRSTLAGIGLSRADESAAATATESESDPMLAACSAQREATATSD